MERWGAAEWEAANILLASRSGGRCETCRQPLTGLAAPSTVRHHRQRRAVGGDRLSNIILIHGGCHTDLHAHPDVARLRGWIVSVYKENPADEPMLYQGHWVLLDDEGTRRAAVEPGPGETF